jgi:hypothetical protein
LTRSQFTYSSPHPQIEAVEDAGGPVTTPKKEDKNTVTTTRPRSVIAGLGMRRKHSYDTNVVQLEDIEEVDSVMEKDSVLGRDFLEEGDETLVDIDGELYKEKEVEIDVTDSEYESEQEDDEPQQGCGIKRKRTIRVIIRSRAFI